MKKIISLLLAAALTVSLCACQKKASSSKTDSAGQSAADIETALNLKNNKDQEWTYDSNADAWVLSVVTAVTNPELPDQQGVSVCVPGAYVTGIDTNGDGAADITSDKAQSAVKGALVIDYDAKITSTNGQIYTAATCPVILNTGAAGYGSSVNTPAATTYAKEGYVNVACGNRGKQDTATDSDGNTYYTGDAPLCLVDQKNATRYVKYNILLGNLPGNVDYFVSTGGSGGGAHATMFAATSNHSDFYDYEIEAGAVGVYKTADGGYSTAVTIDGKQVEISDGAWGCVAYSAITSLDEADMAMAFEYFLDSDYDFGSEFKAKLASLLAEKYQSYINGQSLTVDESKVGLDINSDGDTADTIPLTIEYDKEKYPETNGYGGTYLDFYLAEFVSNLQWYIDSLGYASDWTWFGTDGKALSDSAVAAMSTADKAQAFLEGRYAKGTSAGSERMGGPSGMGGKADFQNGDMPAMKDGEMPDFKDGEKPDFKGGTPPDGNGYTMASGTPDAGSTQSASGSTDSANYSSFDEMLQAYQSDIQNIQQGDKYGNNIVALYNPLNYIGAEGTDNPTWTRLLMGASEGDMSMFSSLNLQIAWLNAGVDSTIEWQWDGGHVPNEIFGDSLALTVDEMYGQYVDGAVKVAKKAATQQTKNGTATEASGKSLTSWVNYKDGKVSFSLADAASYRTAGASKAVPGFDVIDYGQEDYVFGSSTADARHWDTHLLEVLEENKETLSKLFNKS